VCVCVCVCVVKSSDCIVLLSKLDSSKAYSKMGKRGVVEYRRVVRAGDEVVAEWLRHVLVDSKILSAKY